MAAPVIPPEADASSSANPSSKWSIGTLTYTKGALLLTFFLLLLGDFGWMMRERSTAPLSQLLLANFQPSDFIISILFGTIPSALTVIIWPIVSVWSDRTRTKWGRRVPFLMVPTPICTAAIFGLAYTPQIAKYIHQFFESSVSLNHCAIAVFAFFWIIFEVFALVTNNIFIALVNDTVPRGFIGRFFGMFRVVSLGSGIYFNYYLIKMADHYSTQLFVGIGIIYFICFTTMCAFIKEGKYPEPVINQSKVGVIQGIKNYVRECLSHAFYRKVFLTTSVATATMIPVNLFSIFAAKSYGIETADYGKCIAITYVCSACIAFPIGWLTDKYHSIRTGFIFLMLYGITMISAFFIVQGPQTFFVMFIIHGVCSGSYMTATAGLMPVLFPRLKFSQFFSAGNVCFNLIGMVLAPVLGLLMDWTHHNYNLTLLTAGLTALIGCFFWVSLRKDFNQLGGVKNYIAPEA